VAVLYDFSKVERYLLSEPGVKGAFTPYGALCEILRGTGLSFRVISDERDRHWDIPRGLRAVRGHVSNTRTCHARRNSGAHCSVEVMRYCELNMRSALCRLGTGGGTKEFVGTPFKPESDWNSKRARGR